MTKAFDEKRASLVAQATALTVERDKILAKVETMDEVKGLLADDETVETYMGATGGGDGVGGPSISAGEKHVVNPRHTRSIARKPKEPPAAKEKRTRPPVARPVREFLTAHGPSRGDVIIAALQKQGIPGNSIEKYFPRGIRAGELMREGAFYSLSGQTESTSYTTDDAETLDEGMDGFAEQANQHHAKPPMSTAATLDFVHRSGSVTEGQLRLANAMDAASALIARGELVVEDDLIREPPERESNESEDAAE